ncbi:MAG: sigma-70 family RNA polymerase sigma factor [Burkholderiales bacterium]|nr:sigma-70 family RNA polymerase sigma factor [Burkholderiales bacterium]MCW5621485.1 sigma-70 family RNA polymerase sigma factor [Burkholderiales bacterium]
MNRQVGARPRADEGQPRCIGDASAAGDVAVPGTVPFVGLYEAHHSWLVGLLRRRLGNACDAADLAQDAFVRLLLRPRHFDSHEGARAYLSVVAKGLCIDLWRRREIERTWLEVLAAHSDAVEPSAEERAIILEALFEIDAMLRSLPDKVRNAFIMAQIHGMNYREIAAELGVSDRMVKRYMAQAMLHCVLLDANRASPAPVD